MKKLLIISLVLCCLSLAFGGVAFATSAQQTALDGLGQTNATAQMDEGDPAKSIGAAIGVLLSIMGLIFLIIVVYAGITWMTSNGDKTRIEKARKMLIEGTIGLAITLAAYSFTAYVVSKVAEAVIQ